MSTLGFVDKEMELFPEVEASLFLYTRRANCSFDTAVSHALRALGGVDAAKQRGDTVYHIPGYTNQLDTHAYQQTYGEEVQLEKLGQDITGRPRIVEIRLPEKSYDSLCAYVKAHDTPKAVALMRATFLLIICSHGDLWVISPGKEPQQMVIDR